MCGGMVDIQSPTAEIMQGKQRKQKEEETTGWKYIWPALLHREAINEWTNEDFNVKEPQVKKGLADHLHLP